MCVPLLHAGDIEQLAVGGLEQCNAERQIDAHNPEFSRAGEVSVHGVGEHAEHPVDMKTANGTDREWDIANSKEW